jgi:class 3 adenylate cyclase
MKDLKTLQSSIDEILQTTWARRIGQVIPEADTVKLGNDAVELEGTILYADLVESTQLVQGHKDWFAAEIYKSYLLCASELIRNNGGTVTAFDGDRVMGVFIGDSKNSSAAKCALQINHMVTVEINPRIKARYSSTTYQIQHAVGVDTSPLFVAKTGVRGSNDLVWIGRAANFAAKLCSIRQGANLTYITEQVYSKLRDDVKMGSNQKNMWTKFTWDEFGVVAYRSSWRWSP